MVSERKPHKSIQVAAPEPARGYSLAVLVASAALPTALVISDLAFGRSVSPTTWYLSRASGLTLYLLIWASCMLGLGLTTSAFDRVLPRGEIYSLHRFITGLSYGFLVTHLLSLTIDAWMPFSLLDLVVPFRATFREPWTGAGVVAFYLFAGIGLTSALIRRLKFRTWKFVHRLALPLFVLALVHGIGAGTDASKWPVQVLYFVTTSTLLGLVLYRLFRIGHRSDVPRENRPVPYDRFADPMFNKPARSSGR